MHSDMDINIIDQNRPPVSALQLPLTRRELALHYFPHHNPESAVRHLSRWLADDPDLLQALTAQGYHPRQRNITRRQLAVFEQYLGK